MGLTPVCSTHCCVLFRSKVRHAHPSGRCRQRSAWNSILKTAVLDHLLLLPMVLLRRICDMKSRGLYVNVLPVFSSANRVLESRHRICLRNTEPVFHWPDSLACARLTKIEVNDC